MKKALGTFILFLFFGPGIYAVIYCGQQDWWEALKMYIGIAVSTAVLSGLIIWAIFLISSDE